MGLALRLRRPLHARMSGLRRASLKFRCTPGQRFRRPAANRLLVRDRLAFARGMDGCRHQPEGGADGDGGEPSAGHRDRGRAWSGSVLGTRRRSTFSSIFRLSCPRSSSAIFCCSVSDGRVPSAHSSREYSASCSRSAGRAPRSPAPSWDFRCSCAPSGFHWRRSIGNSRTRREPLGANPVWVFLVVTLPLILARHHRRHGVVLRQGDGRIRRDDHLRVQHSRRNADAAVGHLYLHADSRRRGRRHATDDRFHRHLHRSAV